MFDCVDLIETGRKLAGADVKAFGDDDLLESVVAIETLISLAQVSSAHLLAELDVRQITDERHGLKTPTWVARQCGVGASGVRQRFRVGVQLRRDLDEIDERISAGDNPDEGAMSFDHAKVLDDVLNPRVRELFSSIQSEIAELAHGRSVESFRVAMRDLVNRVDQQGVEPDDITVNKLSLHRGFDNTWNLRATLSDEVGHVVSSALDQCADDLFRRLSADHEVIDQAKDSNAARCMKTNADELNRSVLLGLGLGELAHLAMGSDRSKGSVPRATAVMVLCENRRTDQHGNALRESSADLWACDPDLWAVVVDKLGIPVDVGHASRLATIGQRRAIAVRDGGCVFPGCDAQINWVDYHHVVSWQHGGKTDLSNLVALCRHHHGVAHRHGWECSITDDQHTIWRTPDGTRFWGQRHRRRRFDPLPDEEVSDEGVSEQRVPEQRVPERTGWRERPPEERVSDERTPDERVLEQTGSGERPSEESVPEVHVSKQTGPRVMPPGERVSEERVPEERGPEQSVPL